METVRNSDVSHYSFTTLWTAAAQNISCPAYCHNKKEFHHKAECTVQ